MSETKEQLSPLSRGNLDFILENDESTRSNLSLPSIFSNQQEEEQPSSSQKEISTKVTIEDIKKQQDYIDELSRELSIEKMKLDEMKKEFTQSYKASYSQTSLSETDTATKHEKDTGTENVKVTSPRAKHASRPVGLIKRETKFKVEDKIKPLMKGASTLSFDEIQKYDLQCISDPIASPSAKVHKAQMGGNKTLPSGKITGDGEVWVEKLYMTTDGRKRTVFVSKTTGEKSLDEPPTGASKVIFLKESNF